MFFAFLLFSVVAVDVQRDVAPCLWRGARIIVHEESRNFVSFSNFGNMNQGVIRCLKRRSLRVSFGCSNNTGICITNSENEIENVQKIKLYRITNYVKNLMVALTFAFISILIFRLYFEKCLQLFYFDSGKEETVFIALDDNYEPITKIDPSFSLFVDIFKDFRKKHKITQNTKFDMTCFAPTYKCVTAIIFPLKNTGFSLCMISKIRVSDQPFVSPLNFDDAYIYREDCPDAFRTETYIYPNFEAGFDTPEMKLRIKQSSDNFYSANSIVYQSYSLLLMKFIRIILGMKPSLEEFKKLYGRIYEAFNFDALSFFIIRGGNTKKLVMFGDDCYYERVVEMAQSVKSTALGKTSFINNIDGVRYVSYSYAIGDTKYVTVLAIRLDHFILRGPERLVSVLLTMATIFYHMNLSSTSEAMRTKSLIKFVGKVNKFQTIETEKVDGKHKIVSFAGSLFTRISPEEIVEKLQKFELSPDKPTRINGFYGKIVYVYGSEYYDPELSKTFCFFLISDVTDTIGEDDDFIRLKSSVKAIYENIGKPHMVDSNYNINASGIMEELGYSGESITNLLEIIVTEDVNNLSFIEKRATIFRLRDVNGKEIWYASKPMHNKERPPYTSFIYRFTDLGAIHGIKEEVQELNDTLLAADRKGFGLWSINQNNGHILLSIPYMDNTISDCSDLLGFVHEVDRQEFTDCIKTMNRQIKQIRTIRMNFASKDYEWYECTFYLTTPTSGIIIALNVHQAKIISDKLIEVQEQIDLSLYHSNIVQWEFSEHGDLAQIFTNVPVTFQALPLNWDFIDHNVSNDYQEITREAFKKCLKEGVPINIEIPIVLDRIIWISLRGGRSETGDRLFGVYFDMTELINIKEDLNKQKQSAINASLAKSEFLANMSHEIRAPLQGMLAVLELLIMSSTTPTMLESLMTIKTGFYRLLELLNDTLDLAKLEQSRMLPSYCNFSIAAIIDSIIVHFRTAAAEKNIDLKVKQYANVPLKYEGDPHFVERITHNLVSNALKFTSEGSVSISIEGDEDHLAITVEDTGIGIPDDMRKIMFETFTTLDSSITRPYQGSGVGLSVASKLIALVGGKIEVESKLGEGSKFTSRYPFKATYYPYMPKMLQEKKLLHIVMKDSSLTKEENSYFDFYGFINEKYPPKHDMPIGIIYVSNNEEDIKAATKLRKTNPNMQILVEIKENEKPVVLPENVNIALCPLLPSLIRKRLIAAKMEKNIKFENPTINVSKFKELNLHVLLADDNQTNQIVMSKILSKMKCTYACVSNGQEVIAALEKSKFDIVLMDQHMPILDGPGATRIIRASKNKPYCSIPIVAMTASILKEDEDECLNSGMTAFVTKPVSMNRLSNVLLQFTKN